MYSAIENSCWGVNIYDVLISCLQGAYSHKFLYQAACGLHEHKQIEIVDKEYLDLMCDTVDILQVGTRNMSNFELLKALGKINKPIILKRGMSATLNEFKHAAEYIISEGNENVTAVALSDRNQQMNFTEFEYYLKGFSDALFFFTIVQIWPILFM